MFKRDRGRRKFIAADFQEDAEERENAARGWYRIFPFQAEEEVKPEELKWSLCREEQLALVIINIGSYHEEAIPPEALLHISQILSFFREHQKEVILRIVYDQKGKGLEREPSFFSQVLDHMQQLGPLIREASSNIYTLQGVFVGNWGEMHGSRFLTPERLRVLSDTLWTAIGGSCCMAVRRPAQWRMLFDSALAPEKKVGLFDDGMLGTASHMGTFGGKKRTKARWTESWCREDELAFEEELCRKVPNGGEALWSEQRVAAAETVHTFAQMHISYLNSQHDGRLLKQWKTDIWEGQDVYQGVSFYDYIGMHLGYRFVIRGAELAHKKTERLYLKIENVGFANCYEEMETTIIVRQENGQEQSYVLETDVRTWNSGCVAEVIWNIPPLNPERFRVYLQVKRRKDGRILELANRGAKDRVLLGLLTNLK